jgi:hypothetical protein
VLAAGRIARVEDFVGRIADGVVRWNATAAATWLRQLDAGVIDGTATGVGRMTETLSQDLSMSVSGHAQYYALIMAAGVLAAIAFVIFAS